MFEWIRRFPNDAEFIAYTPGFTPDSSLYRGQDMDVAAVTEMCKQHGMRVNTSGAAGAYMARLITEDWMSNGWKSGDYVFVDEVYAPSAQAKDAALTRALWDKSEELVKRVLG